MIKKEMVFEAPPMRQELIALLNSYEKELGTDIMEHLLEHLFADLMIAHANDSYSHHDLAAHHSRFKAAFYKAEARYHDKLDIFEYDKKLF